MQCAHLSSGGKTWRKSLICLLPSALKVPIAGATAALKRAKHGMKKSCCKMWGGRRAGEGIAESDGCWGDRRAGEMGKKGDVATWFIQCSSSAIDNLSTDIS